VWLSEIVLRERIFGSKNMGRHFEDNLGIGKEYEKFCGSKRTFVTLCTTPIHLASYLEMYPIISSAETASLSFHASSMKDFINHLAISTWSFLQK